MRFSARRRHNECCRTVDVAAAETMLTETALARDGIDAVALRRAGVGRVVAYPGAGQPAFE